MHNKLNKLIIGLAILIATIALMQPATAATGSSIENYSANPPQSTTNISVVNGDLVIDKGGNEEWTFSTYGWTYSPTIDSGTAYIGSDDSSLWAVNTSDGTKKWRFTAPTDWVSATPSVADGTVYVGSDDGNMYAVNASDGSEEWRFSTGGIVQSIPFMDGGTLYVGSGDNNLYALDSSTGTEQWNFTANGSIESSPFVSDGAVYVGSTDNNLYAVNASDGTKEWSFTTGGDVGYLGSGPIVDSGTVYVGSQDNNLYAVDASTGSEVWSFNTGDGIRSTPAVNGGTVYIGDTQSDLYALDADTGSKVWNFAIGGTWGSPAVSGGTVYIGSHDSNLYAIGAVSESGSIKGPVHSVADSIGGWLNVEGQGFILDVTVRDNSTDNALKTSTLSSTGKHSLDWDGSGTEGVYYDLTITGNDFTLYDEGIEIVTSDTQSTDASLFVTETISTTMTNVPVEFGDIAPGNSDKAAVSGAVDLIVENQTNIDVDMAMKASDFNGNDPLEAGNMTYAAVNNKSQGLAATNGYVEEPFGEWTGLTERNTDYNRKAYFWLTIPETVESGDYNSTVSFKVHDATKAP